MLDLEATLTVPLVTDEHGTIRFRGSRVMLDTILARYFQGDSAEQIQEGFPTLELSQIHGALAYYYSHRSDVDQYLRERDVKAEEMRARVEAIPDYKEFRKDIDGLLERN